MARSKRLISKYFYYHVTARCINKDWFKLPIPQVWDIMSSRLYFCQRAFNVKIHSFVLMGNHFHLLTQTPDGNLSLFMNYFMGQVSREITYFAGRINQTFGGPFYSSLIKSEIHFLHVYKYIYRNPVEAGLCERAEDYKYSTLFGLIGKSQLLIPVQEDKILFNDINKTLKWLNTNYKASHKEEIRLALKKAEFKFRKHPIKRKISELDYVIS